MKNKFSHPEWCYDFDLLLLTYDRCIITQNTS